MSENTNTPIASVSLKWQPIYEFLCKGDTVFEQMGNLFVLCASVGHILGEKSPLDSKKHQLFRWSSMREDKEIPILTAIAWDACARDMAVFGNEGDIVKICSEYAEAGMQYLYEKVFERFMVGDQFDIPKSYPIEFVLAQEIEILRIKNSIF